MKLLFILLFLCSCSVTTKISNYDLNQMEKRLDKDIRK